MPTVRQLKRYTIPRYPQGGYHLYRTPPLVQLAKTSTAAGLLLGLLQGCDVITGGGGTVGPPPVDPDYLTEADARQIINDIFAENGIELDEDVTLQFDVQSGDSVISQDMQVDGYSSELRTGFEYFTFVDLDSYASLRGVLADTTQHGPIFTPERYPEDMSEYLEIETQAFIDSLRAMGWI